MADIVTPRQDSRVRLWFDPVCPWCWVTYLWLREVERQRPIVVEVALMSLAFLNEGKPGVPEKYKAPHARSLQLGRVLAAAQSAHGPEVLTPMYESMGDSLHKKGERDFDEVNTLALRAAAVPVALGAAAGQTSFDDQLRDDTLRLVDRVGDDMGTPIVEFGDATLFGPVLSRPPAKRQAVELFDAVTTLAECSAFFELKRTRTEEPTFGP